MSQYTEHYKDHYKEQAPKQPEPQPVQINGFQQVLEMLKIADPVFRESLLKRLASKDRELANSLKRDLRDLDIL